MDLIIVRHGESEAVSRRVVEGRADLPLTDRGRRQAQLLAGWIQRNCRISRIYTSPLLRARVTAEIIGESLRQSVVEDADLMEFNNGLLAGTPLSEVAAKYPVIPDVPAHQSVYRQETRIQYRMRAENFMSRVFYENRDQDQVLIVTHGGTINQLLQSFLRLPMDAGVFIASSDGCIHEWSVLGDSRGIIRTNFTGHLE